VTPSVATPGDTNPSDAAGVKVASANYRIAKTGTVTRSNVKVH